MAVFAVYLKGRDEPVLVEGQTGQEVRAYFGHHNDLLGVVPADKIRTAQPGPVKHG